MRTVRVACEDYQEKQDVCPVFMTKHTKQINCKETNLVFALNHDAFSALTRVLDSLMLELVCFLLVFTTFLLVPGSTSVPSITQESF